MFCFLQIGRLGVETKNGQNKATGEKTVTNEQKDITFFYVERARSVVGWNGNDAKNDDRDKDSEGKKKRRTNKKSSSFVLQSPPVRAGAAPFGGGGGGGAAPASAAGAAAMPAQAAAGAPAGGGAIASG